MQETKTLPLVVLVEDNPADVFLVQEAVRKEGLFIQLKVFEDGERAIRYIDDVQPKLSNGLPKMILLDLNLPRRSGMEVLAQIRSNPVFKEVPVVIFTSSESPRERERTFLMGANAYFRKSPDLDEFMKIGNVVRNILLSAGPANHTA